MTAADDIRPTTLWRERRREEAAEFAAGRLPKEECFAAQFYPDDFLARADTVLDAYVAAIEKAPTGPDGYPQVTEAIKTVILALNEIAESGDYIETDERELLCAYLEAIIMDHGIDINAYAASRGLTLHTITDEWREW